MNTLPWSINNFLKKFNKANNVSYGGVTDFKLIMFDNELDLFKLISVYDIQSGYDGSDKSDYFYFKPDDFLQVIIDLKKFKKSEINFECFLISERTSWDHNYSTFTDSGDCYIKKGIAKGELNINQFKLNDFNLEFVCKEDIYSKSSNTESKCSMNKDELKKFVKF